MTPRAKMILASVCMGLALLLGASASRLSRNAREANAPTPGPTVLTLATTPNAASTVAATAAGATPVVTAPPSATATTLQATPAASTGALPASFTCASGWLPHNVDGRRYAFCAPADWSVTIGAAGIPQAGEPAGSMVRVISAEQLAVSGTPRTGTSLTPSTGGMVINIYVTSYEMKSDLPKPPICSGADGAVGSRIVSTCDLDNTSDATSPYRYHENWSHVQDGTYLHVQIVSGKNVTVNGSNVARDVVSSLRFY